VGKNIIELGANISREIAVSTMKKIAVMPFLQN
jgi:hypothetical protein